MSAAETCANPSDAELIARIQSGEQAAYAELIRRHQDRLRAALSFYCSSQAEVEERLQEAFVQAYAQLASYDTAVPFYPWLKGIAWNGLKMELRRLQTARRCNLDYLRCVRLAKLEQDPEGAEAEERAAALRLCLERLPQEQAALIQAKYSDNLPLQELAARMQTTTGALKVRLLRLRQALRTCILKQLAQTERV
ncbi:MAG: sigma-70 family RNA polymerase sigma factor [Planctomycetota bacterium]